MTTQKRSTQKKRCKDLLPEQEARAELTRKVHCDLESGDNDVHIEVAKRKRTKYEDKQEEVNGQKDRVNVKRRRVGVQNNVVKGAQRNYYCRYPNPAAPITMTERFPREVKFNELDDLFKFSYGVLTNLAFPGVDVPFYFASENDWVAVLRAIFKSRVEFSFSKATASRPISPVPLIDGIAIPLLLADCINSYGEIVVAQSSAIVYPRPQDVEQGELQQAMDVEAPVRFSRLVSTLRMRDMLKVGRISSDYSGTPAYVLAAFGTDFGRVMPAQPFPPLAFNASVAFVKSWFSEFTQSDAVLCAIMANGYAQNLLNSDHWPWSASHYISYVPGIRSTMCTGC